MRDMDIDQLSADGAQETVRGVTPVEPRTVAEMGPIERRFAEAWHDLNCGTDHPITEHEPFDRDEGDIPWSEFTAALAKHGLHVTEAADAPLLREALTQLLVAAQHQRDVSPGAVPQLLAAVDVADAALAAVAPTVERCDRIVNNGMGEPTECGRTLPCEYHDAEPQRAVAGLDRERLREAVDTALVNADADGYNEDVPDYPEYIAARAAAEYDRLAAEAAAKEQRT